MISLISCEFSTKSTKLFVHGYKIQQLFEKLLQVQQLCDIITLVIKRAIEKLLQRDAFPLKKSAYRLCDNFIIRFFFPFVNHYIYNKLLKICK